MGGGSGLGYYCGKGKDRRKRGDEWIETPAAIHVDIELTSGDGGEGEVD